jgi:beta-galactosidase
MRLGCAWYPEHWHEARWPEDLSLMRDAGMNVVRIAEFAWSRMEPEEGRFEFDWLDRAIALAAEHGLQSVVGTPTAAPPAWLTFKYPETLATRETGARATHGNRCHYSPTSVLYRRFCRRIAEEMAKRFGHNRHVIGWQIDNEYNSVSYDDDARRQFQAWLRRRYRDLDSLNQHWTTAYWSEEYTDWEQIPLPIGYHNPSLMLEWRRFITHVYRTFQREQIDAIRKHAAPRQWITHNFMGWFDLYDHYELTKDLDIASWDNYIGTGHLDYLSNGAVHDLTRGFKRRNFWLMETQPGWVNWSGVNNPLDRGEVRCMAWHAVGHGADAVLYWQWRAALGGQEQYHGSIVAPDGRPRPLYEEVQQLGNEFAGVGRALRDTTVAAPIAILHSYDDRWAINFQRHHRDFDPVRQLVAYYRPLRARGYAVDVIHPMAPLRKYRLVIAPWLHMLDERTARHLRAYVRSGGHLLLGPRSGMKDPYDALLPSRQPGPLAGDLGAYVEEFYALDRAVPVAGTLGDGEARIWAEWLQADEADVEALLSYGPSNGWLDGQPAMVTRKLGRGRMTYVGACLDGALMDRVAEWLTQVSGVNSPPLAPPGGVELCVRAGERGSVCILINHTAEPREVALPKPAKEVLSGRRFDAALELPPRGVAVLVLLP